MKWVWLNFTDMRTKIFLAPMLEPNDIAFRILCKKCDCDLTFTGMTNPLSKKNIILDDKPAMQLFTNETKGIQKFIREHDRDVSMWDFNLGCPSKLSKKLQHGAFLQNNVNQIEKILREIRSATKKPCSVKLRKSKNTLEIAKLAENIGFNYIIIHPRTLEQGYSGKIDYDFALRIKKSVQIPVVLSGDINEKNFNDYKKDFDYLMIGRTAIGNPSIFSKLKGKNKKCNFDDYLKVAKKYKISFSQIKYQALNFTKNMNNARIKRGKLIKAKTIEEIKKIMY